MIRFAETRQQDDEFLYPLYRSTREEEIKAWGWGEQEAESFLWTQYRVQKQAYQTRYPEADHRIILLQEQKAGRIILNRDENEIRLLTRFSDSDRISDWAKKSAALLVQEESSKGMRIPRFRQIEQQPGQKPRYY